MKKMLLVVAALAFALSTLPAAVMSAETDGARLLEERCSVCHPSARPKSKQKTLEQWTATVNRMIGKGAKLSDDEKTVLIDFLSKNYKP